eukprot:TRINITY_DN1664_c0_g1_i3.p1 TRINITY_DN1664_c0_g1~~TRINITY_DN1664_c0_g1_i3.p1  ORF type:complete len:430 (+),score=67.90 TRINITY_DN1664_c0_g1_i3:50-1339(+)
MGNLTSRSPNPSVKVDDFEVICLVGKGAFGKVWKVRKKDSGKILAMKVLKKAQVLEQNMVEHTELEKEIMGCFGDHPFIVNLFYAFQTGEKLYFVLDYLSGGSLFHHLSTSEEPFSEEVTAYYSAEVILGLETLHHHNIVYRDLKLENILLDSEGHIKLTDFGLSAKVEKDRLIHSFSGTALYLAPEILTDTGSGHGKSVDFWALGVLIHVMLTQEPPFWSENNRALFNLIICQEIEFDIRNFSLEAVSLLRGLLTREITTRLGCRDGGIQELKDHRFFQKINWTDHFAKKHPAPLHPGPNEIVEAMDYTEDSLVVTAIKRDPLLMKNENAFENFSFISTRLPPPSAHVNSTTSTSTGTGSSSVPSMPRPRKSTAPASLMVSPHKLIERERDKRKELWIPDSQASACFLCAHLFTPIRRRVCRVSFFFI